MSRATFAEALRKFRIDQDLTQEEFSDKYSIRRWHIAQAEVGRDIAVRHLEQIVKKFPDAGLAGHLEGVNDGPKASTPRTANPRNRIGDTSHVVKSRESRGDGPPTPFVSAARLLDGTDDKPRSKVAKDPLPARQADGTDDPPWKKRELIAELRQDLNEANETIHGLEERVLQLEARWNGMRGWFDSTGHLR